MIKVDKLNKLYFQNKKNENHVLKDVSITFPNKGLVVLLGKSGSGKTTLLNIISGLDKPNSGSITIMDQTFNHYDEKGWNQIRNKSIGFIFQNYKILEDVTVYENIELVLKMNGLDQYDDRIQYVLNAVGLNDYEKRLSSALSGGEQQRVSFARALAKDADIIIADEPTGNLDSKNTVEAMDILAKIAESRLVVMVTHDELLAECYADRIIKMQDGSVFSDEPNNKKDKTLLLEHLINEKEYQKDTVKSNHLHIDYYHNDEDKTNVEVYKKNDTLYVKSDLKVRLAEDVYREAKTNDFELKGLEKKNQKSFITFKHAAQLALKRLGKLNLYNKLLYLTLAMVGVIASIATGLLGKVSVYDDSDIVVRSRNYVNVEIDNTTYENVLELTETLELEHVTFVMDQQKFKLETPTYYQITNFLEFYAYPSDISILKEEQIIYGSYPTEVNQIVIDELLAKKLINDHNERGLDSYEDFLHTNIVIQSSGTPYDIKSESYLKFEIVGISNDQSPTLWMSNDLIYSLLVPNVIDKDILIGEIAIDGEFPVAFKEVIINSRYTSLFGGRPQQVGTAVGSLSVTGVYDFYTDEYLTDIRNIMLSDGHLIEQLYFEVNNIFAGKTEFLFYSDTPEEDIVRLLEKDIYAFSEYQELYKDLVEDANTENSGYYMFSILALFISAVSIYFIIRSSLLSRVYEISVYRALGTTKRDILRIFIVEIVFITLISSVLAFIATTAVLLGSQREVVEFVQFVIYTPFTIIISVSVLFVINILFGVLPVVWLLKRTPADLFAKYDI